VQSQHQSTAAGELRALDRRPIEVGLVEVGLVEVGLVEVGLVEVGLGRLLSPRLGEASRRMTGIAWKNLQKIGDQDLQPGDE
jgi:hypothetical protein